MSIQSSGKKRLILDFRHVNLYVYKQKFKCEDLRVALSIISRGFSLFKFDLKSGYHHVEIFRDHRKFLAFAWDFGDGKTRFFQFTVLPFGLSSAPYLFTKLLKPVIKMWRCHGIPIVVFLDDGLGGGATELIAKINSLKVNSDLIRFGFLVNSEKSQWDPSHVIIWLGSVIDTNQGTIAATDQRMLKLANFTDSFSQCESRVVKARDLASFIGMIISLFPFVGNVTRIMTRSLYQALNSRSSWFSSVTLTDEAMREIMFWKLNARSLNGRPAWPAESKPSKIVYSDASNHACSSFVENEGKIFQQNWSPAEQAKSSTWRELKAVHLAIESFIYDLKGQQVAWFTDNQNVVSIVHSGSRVEELQCLALDIFTMCVTNSISLEMKWIPRNLNTEADCLSRIIDFDDYSLNDYIFRMLDVKWGPHSVDRFACSYNAKLVRFNSRFYQPGTEAVDAFTQDWSHENNWLVPPVSLVVRVINHMRLCKAEGTIVVPVWKSSYFWTILSRDGRHWSPFVHDWLLLPDYNCLFVRGKAKNRLFGAKRLPFKVAALRVMFNVAERLCLAGFCTEDDGSCTNCS